MPSGMEIYYIRLTDRASGRVTEYYENGADPAKLAKTPEKRMDCVDCHNRPTHIYMPPDRSMDAALMAHRIDPTLPYAKQQGVEALSAGYKSTDEAMQAIATGISAFYRGKYPDIFNARARDVQQMVAEVQRIYRGSIFPEMKVDWRTHPDNIGHFYFNGCFRCHDGNHATKDGKTITKDCNVCHTMLAQKEGDVSLEGSAAGVTFKHPVDLGDMTAVNCSDCHGAGTAQ